MAAKIFSIIAIAYTLLVTTLSLIHLGKITIGNFSPTDKMMHFTAYIVLNSVWLFYYILKKEENQIKFSGYLKVSGLVILFGMLIEVLQGTLTTYRTPDWFDILANSVAVFAALLIFILFGDFMKRLKRKISSFL